MGWGEKCCCCSLTGFVLDIKTILYWSRSSWTLLFYQVGCGRNLEKNELFYIKVVQIQSTIWKIKQISVKMNVWVNILTLTSFTLFCFWCRVFMSRWVFFPLDSFRRFSLLFWNPFYFYLTLMCLCVLLSHNTNYSHKKKKKESLINYFILTFEAESSKDTHKKRFS